MPLLRDGWIPLWYYANKKADMKKLRIKKARVFTMNPLTARAVADIGQRLVRGHERIVDKEKILLWREQAAENDDARRWIFPSEWRELCDLALRGWDECMKDIRGSSEVERRPVKSVVAGSIPAPGATDNCLIETYVCGMDPTTSKCVICETPKTDAACEEAGKVSGKIAGIPAMYGYMVEHAKEMERRWNIERERSNRLIKMVEVQ
jgi:hypothetical protein